MKHALLDNGQIMLPGDFIVVHGDDLIDRMTQLATHSHWNHAAVIIDADGTIAEVTNSGLHEGNVRNYPSRQVIRITSFTSRDRKQIVDYAHDMLRIHASYGYLTLASVILNILTHSRASIRLDHTLICSEFVANCLMVGGYPWEQDTSLITPADLYRQFVKG